MEDQHQRNLAAWLAPRLGADGDVEVTGDAALSTGFSAETVAFEARWSGSSGPAERRLVLRRESAEPAVYPQQAPGHDVEVEIQHEVMRALTAGTSVPLARVVGYEGGSDVLGSPFFVMDYVDGVVPLVTPPYPADGFFAQGTPDQRRQMILEGVRRLAEIHALDWAAHGLGWLLPPGEEPTARRQVDIWHRYTERELKGRSLPLVSSAYEWLRANAPAHDPATVTFNWGDPRPGNMIWQDFRCVCVTDFEAACIAPFGVDLGWWLMFDRWSHEQSGAERPAGEPTRDEQAAAYFEAAGRSAEPTHWYETFAAARYCAIVVRVINRSVERGLMPADSGYWADNQATACLTELLGMA
jgi:aminoglycoside phosphotransferase (APT) family kinase protein